MLKAFYEGYKLIWPNKCCTAKYYDSGPAALLFSQDKRRHYRSLPHALKWERPESILITKTNGTKISAELGHVLIEMALTKSELQVFYSPAVFGC